MRKTILLSSVLAVSAAMLCLAHPIRGNSAAKSLAFTDVSAPVNLWTWPDKSLSTVGTRSKNPKTVWTPDLDTWYLAIARNGYVFMPSSDKGEWWEDGVTSQYESGYSVGAFLDLPAGHYVIRCDVDGYAQFQLAFYEPVEGGYLWSSYASMSAQSYAGQYERIFTVPGDGLLTLLMPTSNQTSAPPLTVTDIEIYRID